MPKKSRRSRLKYKGQAPYKPPMMAEAQHVTPPTQRDVAAVRPAAGGRAILSAEHYSYVPRELKYIALLSGSLFLILIVLYFFLR